MFSAVTENYFPVSVIYPPMMYTRLVQIETVKQIHF